MASWCRRRLGAHGAGGDGREHRLHEFFLRPHDREFDDQDGRRPHALVIGGELISSLMDWTNRNVSILFGDGAPPSVLQATDRDEGVLADKLGCYGDLREILHFTAWWRQPGLGTRRHRVGVRRPGNLQTHAVSA